MIKKNYLLIIPSFLITLIIWYMFAFMKVKCICPWNEWSLTISTIVGLLVLLANILVVHILIKNENKRIYAYYIGTLVISEIIFLVIMGISVSLLT